MTTGSGRKLRRHGVKANAHGRTRFRPNRVLFHPFGTPFCLESVSPRRADLFPGLDAKFGRESASGEEFCPIGAQCAVRAGRLRQFCAKVWRTGSDAILVRILIAEIFLRTSVLYPWRWLAVVLAFCCIAFCKGDLLSSFLPRVIFVSLRTLSALKQTRAGILRRVVAVVLSVSLLATKTPVLR